jgi:hypothetical protein
MIFEKIRASVQERFKSQRSRLVAMVGAGAVLLLIIGVAVAILWPRPPDPRIPQIIVAVHATFPTICRSSGYKVAVVSGSKPDTFEVRCNPNLDYLGKSPLLTINVSTCRITATPSMMLEEDYPELYGMPLLANCPLPALQ